MLEATNLWAAAGVAKKNAKAKKDLETLATAALQEEAALQEKPEQPEKPAKKLKRYEIPETPERKSLREKKEIERFNFQLWEKANARDKQFQWMMWCTVEDLENDPKTQFELPYSCGKYSQDGAMRRLSQEWVDWRWPDKKHQNEWMEQPDEWIELSAGARPEGGDPPLAYLEHLPIEYPQVGDTCLASSFASVLHMAGYVAAGQKLNANIEKLSQGKELLVKFINFVNAMGITDEDGIKLVLRKQTSYNIFTTESRGPVSVTLQTLNGGTTHAVAIYQDCVVDSS